MDIELAHYNKFLELWRAGYFGQQRLGQAFYNHFNLHKLNNQSGLKGLYELNGTEALNTINEVFHLH